MKLTYGKNNNNMIWAKNKWTEKERKEKNKKKRRKERKEGRKNRKLPTKAIMGRKGN